MYEIIPINNLTLIFSSLNNMKTASLGIFLSVGSRLEPKRLKGIAHFLEHMVFKGTKSYSHRKIKQEIEGRGGLLNAFTTQEMTAYQANFLKKNFPKTLNILLDMVQNPLLRPSDINKERKVILEEIKMCNDLGSLRAGVLLEGLLWKGHPLGEEVIGYSSTVRNIQKLDLEYFKNKYYLPGNIVISFCGDFSKKEVVRLIKTKTKRVNRKVSVDTVGPQALRGVHIITERKSFKQSHLCMGFRSFSYRSKERPIIQLINVILGANMSSRLFEELREKKSLCYDISTEARFYKDSGAFLIHLGLDENKIIVAITAILKELQRLKQKEVPNRELSRAKDYFLGQIAMSLEVPYGRMSHFAHSYIAFGKIYDFNSLKREIEVVSPGQIKHLAKRLFRFDNICISCVGNIKENLQTKIRAVI